MELDLEKNMSKIREDFPTFKHKTWFATAGRGPILRPVWDAVKSYWEYRLIDSSLDQPNTKDEARKLLHADEEELCWVTRVSEGLNLIAGMIKPSSGENVVVTDLGYPSNVFVWLPYQKQGVKIKRVQNREGDITPADFEEAVNDETKVVCISYTEWASGLTHDLREISNIAHEHGAYLVVDACQSTGAINVDCHSTNVDFLVTCAHKWLCCPSGAGIFYIRGDLIDDFDPSYRFYRTVEEAFKHGPKWEGPDHDNIEDYNKPLVRSADKFDTGCTTPFSIWGLHAALKYFNDLGIKNIQGRVKRLGGYLIDGLLDQGCKVNTPLEPERRHGLLTYSADSHKMNEEIYEALLKSNVMVYLRYSGGIGGIRAATHFFNTEEEIDNLLKIQKKVLK